MGKQSMRYALSCTLSLQLLAGTTVMHAGDLKIPVSHRNLSTPPQKLNREGVSELKRGHREKAKRLFYRAYLLDPQDPFTLNNLGYIAELEGDADRAMRFYELATNEHTGAIIDQSSDARLKGKSLEEAYREVQDSDQDISRINEQAVVLFGEGRVFEAKNLLLAARARHPEDPFLLNNLGYAMESVGNLEAAARFYSAAASMHSTKLVVVTARASWRGRPISEIAAANASAIERQQARGEGLEASTARLNLEGVAAINDRQPNEARGFFLQAYERDPQNAFTLNNLGYITELNGDWETAQFYYAAARSGRDAKDRVTYSTRRDAEGKKVDALADQNSAQMETALSRAQQERRRRHEPFDLIPRTAPTNAGQPKEEPVPPVAVPAPVVPTLPGPNSEHERNLSQPLTSTPQPQEPRQ